AFHHDVRRFEGSGHVALFDPPFDEDVAVPATVQLRSAGATGVVDVEDRRFGLPRDGELGYRLLEDVGCADDHRHRLSPIAGLGFGEDGLVLETGQHPELVATGHVPGGADVDHAGMLLQEPPDVADPEPGEGVGRAHDCDPEAFLRGDVVAVACLAPHPLDAVDTPHPGTDCLAWGRRLGPAEIPPARPLHCLDDL